MWTEGTGAQGGTNSHKEKLIETCGAPGGLKYTLSVTAFILEETDLHCLSTLTCRVVTGYKMLNGTMGWVASETSLFT